MKPDVFITHADAFLSPHLAWDELACHDAIGTPYPVNWRSTRAVKLAAVFEAIRATCGDQPIEVLSAYRTPEYNRQCPGAARTSQHVQGRALDLRPPQGWSVRNFHRIVRVLADEPASFIGGIGIYDTFVHVDVRPRPADGHLAEWDLRSSP